MAKRIIRWIEFSVVFALLPLLFAWLFRVLGGNSTNVPGTYTQELLFFIVMICANSLGDMNITHFPAGIEETASHAFAAIFLIGAVVAAVIYGSIVKDAAAGVSSVVFLSNSYLLCKFLAPVFAGLGLVTQIVIGLGERKIVPPLAPSGQTTSPIP